MDHTPGLASPAKRLSSRLQAEIYPIFYTLLLPILFGTSRELQADDSIPRGVN